MAGEVTSPQVRGVWHEFGSFLRSPGLPDRVTGVRADALPVLAKLFGLDVLLMGTLIALAAVASAMGLKMPSHMLDQLELGPALIAFILIGAPIGEELLFRSWLSGRPGHVGAFLALVATAFLFSVFALSASDVAALTGLAVLVAGAIVAAYLLWRKRGRRPMPFFQRHFRWFYFASAAAFASVHLTNFAEGNALILLPLTLPQFLLGLILGYVRVHFGLWANMLFHAAHNSLFIGLLLAGAS